MSFADMYDHIALHVLTASLVFQVGIVWGITAHTLRACLTQASAVKYPNFLSFVIYRILCGNVSSSGKSSCDLEAYGLEDDTILRR